MTKQEFIKKYSEIVEDEKLKIKEKRITDPPVARLLEVRIIGFEEALRDIKNLK